MRLDILQILCLAVCCGAVAQGSPQRYLQSDGPLQMNESVSSDVINVTSFRSDIECLDACSERGCAAVSVMLSNRTCQLLIINDASQSPGPIGSHVRRALGSEDGAMVWMVEDFDNIVRARMFKVTAFNSTSSGRNGSIQPYVIGATGCYRFEASGAAGGSNSFQGFVGGRGAIVSGSFNLTFGTRLSIVIGQAGGNAANGDSGGGGGGGSFVYGSEDSWLYLAAGAGGGAAIDHPGLPGQAGRNGTNSVGFDPDYCGFGGAMGQPGLNIPGGTAAGCNHGGCGAGWLSRPVNPRRGVYDGDRGGSRNESWVGGQAGTGGAGNGGFGGGGGAGSNAGATGNKGAPGAGGGYSGGGAGLGISHGGGGGGSFCSGGDCGGTTGGNTGGDNGFVLLRLVGAFNAC